jgi:hypothetical protein
MEKAAVTLLADGDAAVLCQFRDYFCFARTGHAVRRKHLKLQVIRRMTIGAKKDFRAILNLFLQQLLYIRDDVSGIRPAVEWVAFFHETAQDVIHDYSIGHIPFLSLHKAKEP